MEYGQIHTDRRSGTQGTLMERRQIRRRGREEGDTTYIDTWLIRGLGSTCVHCREREGTNTGRGKANVDHHVMCNACVYVSVPFIFISIRLRRNFRSTINNLILNMGAWVLFSILDEGHIICPSERGTQTEGWKYHHTRKYIHTPRDKDGRTQTWRDIHAGIHTKGYLRKDSDNTSRGRTQEIHTEYTPHDAIHTTTIREVYTRMETNIGIHTEGHTPIKIYEG